MNLNGVIEKYAQPIKAIILCGENKCFEPAVRLVYSAIDSLSWLYSDQTDLNKRKVKIEYEKWINDFLIPELRSRGYDCTAMELYLARCSQLHTFSAIAKNQNNTRIVAYALGDEESMVRTIQKLPEIENKSGEKQFVIIHIGDLVNSFINATHHFFKLIESNKEIFEKVIMKADHYYTPLDQHLFDIESNN